MVLKRSIVLILSLLITSSILAKTVIYQPVWKIPEIDEEHGPFYTDTQLGLVIQGGNTIDNTVAFQTTNSYLTKNEIFIIGGHYNYGWDESGLSSRNWDARFRYQRTLTEKLQPFAAVVFEGDPFAGFNDRTNLDLGVSFPFQGKFLNWHIEGGYRYTEEEPTVEAKRYQNKLRFQLGGDRKVGNSGEISTWIRYLPFLSDTRGDLPNHMLDYGIAINSYFAEHLYLNLTFLGNYREIPLEDRKKNDYKLIGSVGLKI